MKDNGNSGFENKVRTSVFLLKSTLELVKGQYMLDDCRNQSEYIEKAILFYSGYVSSEKNNDFLSSAFLSALKNYTQKDAKEFSRIMFKLAVEIAMMNNILAFHFDIDKETLREVRAECEKVVRQHHGDFGLSEAIDWQKG